MKLLPEERRVHNFNEVEIAFTESVATREAKRCLRCDYHNTTTGQPACR